jgi:translation initiation factor IF-2
VDPDSGPELVKILTVHAALKNFLGADEQAIGPGRVAVVTGWDREPETGDAWQSGTAKIDSEKPAASPAGRAPAAADAEENLVPIVIKSDTAGRAEAVRHKLADLKVEGVNFKILAAGAGEISDADIKLAGATPGALVVGFGVSAGAAVSDLAERRGVTLASFPLIYELLDWLTAELKKRSQSKSGPVKIGSGRLLKIFSVKKERQVVGGEVAEGVIRAGQRLKITRRDNELGLARVVELQQQKTAAREVEAGKQFGALLESKIGLAAGDQWELFESSD